VRNGFHYKFDGDFFYSSILAITGFWQFWQSLPNPRWKDLADNWDREVRVPGQSIAETP